MTPCSATRRPSRCARALRLLRVSLLIPLGPRNILLGHHFIRFKYSTHSEEEGQLGVGEAARQGHAKGCTQGRGDRKIHVCEVGWGQLGFESSLRIGNFESSPAQGVSLDVRCLAPGPFRTDV